MAYFKNEWNEIFVSILDEPNGKWLVSHTNPQAPLFVTSEALRFLKIIAAPSTATIIEEKQKTEAQIKRYEIIKELIEKPDYIRDKKQRKEKIKELAEYHCTTEKRISRLYYSYLANKFWKIGQGKKRISKNATRNKIFDWAIREFYYSAKRISLEDAYDHMIYAKYMGKDGKIKPHHERSPANRLRGLRCPGLSHASKGRRSRKSKTQSMRVHAKNLVQRSLDDTGRIPRTFRKNVGIKKIWRINKIKFTKNTNYKL